MPPHPDSRGLLCCNGPFCLETTFLRGDPPVGCAPLEGLGGRATAIPPNFFCKGPRPMQGPELQTLLDTYFWGAPFPTESLCPPPPQTSPGLGPFPLFGAGMGKELRSPERSTVKFCFPNQDRWGRLDDKTTALQHLTHSAVPLTQQQPPPQKCVSPPRSRNLLPPPPPAPDAESWASSGLCSYIRAHA